MRTPQVVALLGVGGLLVAAVAYGTRGSADADAAPSPGLARLQQAAALEPCPSALAAGLPDLTLPCLGGGPDVTVDGAPGRPTLVNVYGTWCDPCVREVPSLVAFHARAGDRVGVVGVLVSDTADNGLAFAPQMGVTYPSVVDGDGVALSRFGAALPRTLFVRADGTVAFVQSGGFDSADQIAALTREHLGVSL